MSKAQIYEVTLDGKWVGRFSVFTKDERKLKKVAYAMVQFESAIGAMPLERKVQTTVIENNEVKMFTLHRL